MKKRKCKPSPFAEIFSFCFWLWHKKPMKKNNKSSREPQSLLEGPLRGVFLTNSYSYSVKGQSPREEVFFYKRKRTRHSHWEASTDGDRQKLSNQLHPSCSDPETAVIGHKGPQEGKGQEPWYSSDLQSAGNLAPKPKNQVQVYYKRHIKTLIAHSSLCFLVQKHSKLFSILISILKIIITHHLSEI